MIDINQRIDEAAWKLFTERGYTQVTMDDIAAELDARFALMAGEFRRLFTVLESAFLLSTPNAAP